jgi:hypothetical protein
MEDLHKLHTDCPCSEPAFQVRELEVWRKQINEDISAAQEALSRMEMCDTRTAALLGRATFPLGFASDCLADIAKFSAEGIDSGTLRPEIDASVTGLIKAFGAAQLRARAPGE